MGRWQDCRMSGREEENQSREGRINLLGKSICQKTGETVNESTQVHSKIAWTGVPCFLKNEMNSGGSVQMSET